MGIKEIIDAERWDRNVFDPEGRHNTASIHNASLDRIEAGVSCVSEYVAELEAELEEYKGHFVDGLKECWYRGESIKSLQEHLDTANKRIAELEVLAPQWQPIETAPKDGAEIIGWREDCGAMLIRYTSPIEFLTDAELADLDEASADQSDWFYADFIAGGRLEGSDAPTHWMPLPKHPAES